MIPVQWVLVCVLQFIVQQGSHLNKSVGHDLDVFEPLLVNSLVRENDLNQLGSVGWWRGVQWSNNLLELGLDSHSLFWTRSDQRQRTNSLSVKTHVLGKRLRKNKVGQLSVSNGLVELEQNAQVLNWRTRAKSLVGHVQEWQQLLLRDHVQNLVPLLQLWINTGRVVATSVEKNNGTWLGSGQVGEHSLLVQCVSLEIVIFVFFSGETGFFQNCDVVSPSWVWHKNFFRCWVECSHKLSQNSQRTSSRDTLRGENTSVLQKLLSSVVV
ncbi:hypothetical protein OGAPHI_000635 [Ogataea philodendri]|uniref:Secreted protein n=1 Tax=Ogataea philodendri TaxID=1378263 RepID=A0A9P8T9T7_9ASCO|nr:uncharacterized protein OGAPHI_000635 [Ogataea philodendri]KAH3670924.1 hypothetical protein OGAPHI_000635 [Ogataea philodendri]